ncbi:hypothetical protein NMD1_02704 [Novosphingobium sp. MD-1]|nr:hypothetical protein NMD1_02704 [Novosphingobium sp. MD-1]
MAARSHCQRNGGAPPEPAGPLPAHQNLRLLSVISHPHHSRPRDPDCHEGYI